MKTKVVGVTVYSLVTIYFYYLMVQCFQVSVILSQTKTISQAMDLLELDSYPIFVLASKLMADGRSVGSVMDIILGSINIPVFIIVIIVLCMFRNHRGFWDIFIMFMGPKLVYLVVIIPLVYGALNQNVNATFYSVNFMATIMMGLCIIAILIYFSKMIYFIVVSLK